MPISSLVGGLCSYGFSEEIVGEGSGIDSRPMKKQEEAPPKYGRMSFIDMQVCLLGRNLCVAAKAHDD